MTLFSVAFEGDRPLTAYPKLAKKAEALGLHSFQIYDHLPYKPAWPIAFLSGDQTKRILVGPVTVPVFLYHPIILARNLEALSELTHGRAILGISRGAYAEHVGESVDRSIHNVLETVDSVANMIRNIPAKIKPELYIGTSGPRLAFQAASRKIVKGIVVDNLWNPEYAKRLRAIIDEAQQKAHRKEKALLIARPFTMLSESKEKAIKDLNPVLTSYLPHLVANSPMLEAAGLTYSKLMKIAHEKSTLPKELIENFAACGAPRDIELQVEELLAAGVDQICFGHPLGSNSLAAMSSLSKTILASFNQIDG